MKIIKISQEKTFFNLDERRQLEKMKDEVYKKAIIEYYQKYAHQSHAIDVNILKMVKEFKDDDFIMSILYEDLYNGTKDKTFALTEQLQKIKLEEDRPNKIQKLLDFYVATHPDADGYEIATIGHDMRMKTIEEINAYIDKYATNWIK
jgi:hypothetical protein